MHKLVRNRFCYREKRIGQIEADKLTKLALNIKTSFENTVQAINQGTVNGCNDIEWSDDEEETITMKKSLHKHIKSEIEINNKAFVNKSNSLWDKLNSVSNEIKSVNLKSSHVNVITETVTETPNRKREERISATNKTTPGTYSNAVKSGLPSSSNKPVSLNRTNLGDHHDTQNQTYMEKQRSKINSKYTDCEVNSTYPRFLRSSEKKILFLVLSSTLKKMSPKKMSTEQISTKVKTIRGGRIRDIEDCFNQYISEGKLDCVGVIVVHVGTNNVSYGDSVHAIIDDYRNLICTVRQSLLRTKLKISSILPRPTHYQANRTISDVDNRLLSQEEQHVEILDNTLNFHYGDHPNLTLFAVHVHTNVAGAKVLSHNIISCVNTLLICQIVHQKLNQIFNR
ncbi:unnamed protein product [Mytilus coruscus]|uniref:Uncharacterized protein n=1 Tax=Mytilus coruscus TaxID=42192 RepID=A0A6J8D5Q7_MYTCO|nr:unnamed protein product [Mytilus coruscus]